MKSDDDIPILEYRPRPTRPTRRQRIASTVTIVGVVAAMIGAFSILLTVELLFLMLVDLCTIRRLQPGEAGYFIGSMLVSLAMIGVSICAHQLAKNIAAISVDPGSTL